jgi:hypothetical protein
VVTRKQVQLAALAIRDKSIPGDPPIPSDLLILSDLLDSSNPLVSRDLPTSDPLTPSDPPTLDEDTRPGNRPLASYARRESGGSN